MHIKLCLVGTHSIITFPEERRCNMEGRGEDFLVSATMHLPFPGFFGGICREINRYLPSSVVIAVLTAVVTAVIASVVAPIVASVVSSIAASTSTVLVTSTISITSSITSISASISVSEVVSAKATTTTSTSESSSAVITARGTTAIVSSLSCGCCLLCLNHGLLLLGNARSIGAVTQSTGLPVLDGASTLYIQENFGAINHTSSHPTVHQLGRTLILQLHEGVASGFTVQIYHQTQALDGSDRFKFFA